MTGIEMRVVGFAPATPGWRLWLVNGLGKPEEVALAGWVTLAETLVEHDTADRSGDPAPERKTGYRSIHPGWVSDGEVVTRHPGVSDGDVWVVGPGERAPSPEELAEWGDSYRVRQESIKQATQA
jgi:hypothetical protein